MPPVLGESKPRRDCIRSETIIVACTLLCYTEREMVIVYKRQPHARAYI